MTNKIHSKRFSFTLLTSFLVSISKSLSLPGSASSTSSLLERVKKELTEQTRDNYRPLLTKMLECHVTTRSNIKCLICIHEALVSQDEVTHVVQPWSSVNVTPRRSRCCALMFPSRSVLPPIFIRPSFCAPTSLAPFGGRLNFHGVSYLSSFSLLLISLLA